MKLYFKLALGYFPIAVLIVFASREDWLGRLIAVWDATLNLVPAVGKIAISLALTGAVIAVFTSIRSKRASVLAVVMAFVGTLLFHGGFTLVKTSMPYIAPFFADPMLADWDKLLHGGRDAWEIAHQIGAHLPMDWLVLFYLEVWVWPAICLPVIIAALDTDSDRVRRTMILYMLAWVLLGNVVALSGMSVGPVFYDRLLDTARFDGLTQALLNSEGRNFVDIQDFLWLSYTENEQVLGSGISAFPSVHVGIAAVTAIYLFERSRLLAPFGLAFLVIILFLSVYTGYHYALDGYASIFLIGAAWVWLHRRRPAAVDNIAGHAQPA
jgi:hypothetical protein